MHLDDIRVRIGGDKPPFILRTSDRMLFKRCRRLWGWLSHLQQGRVLREAADYLWFGTGIHYALEDYHGLNLYGHPALAFMAFVHASRQAKILPGTWLEHQQLGVSLMCYYVEQWLPNRDSLRTYEVDGIPQCEVNGVVDLEMVTPDGRPLLYGFTLDRIVIDEYSRLWIVEYKTAKAIKIFNLDVDEQITAYCWAAWKLYQKPVAGVVYQQFRKNIPTLPKILATGKVSIDTKQHTSSALYAKQLTDMYGDVEHAPKENIIAYNRFCAQEDEDKDRFVVRSRIERSQKQLEAFDMKVRMEVEDITNPNLPMYPNPTWMCDAMCPLQAACVAMDDGSDWQEILDAYSLPTADGLTQREKEQTKWRMHLPEPQEVSLPEAEQQYNQLLQQTPQPSQEDQAQPQRPEEQFLEELGVS